MQVHPSAMSAWIALVLAGPVLAGGGDPAAASGGARWGAEYFPNVELVSHEGRPLRFFDDLIKDKVVVVNFIYTSCPDTCPLETAKLSEVCELLGERVGQDVFLYSISIDPEHDTPEVLREYSQRYQTPPGWLFLTGAAADIRLVREKLGMIRADETELNQHTLNLLIGNQATGRWMKRSPMENPYLLATQIGSWLSDWKLPPEPGLDYAEAPKLRSISRGENLFRTRCSACHLLGPEDGLSRQGPNLLGVTARRERAWLARWLAEPDAMLAEGDPIAVELFQAYRNLPMPNMRLNEVEVAALIEYMEEEESWHTAQAVEAVPEAEHEGLPPCCQKEGALVLSEAAPPPELRWLPDPAPAVPVEAAARAAWPQGSLRLCLGLIAGLAGLMACLRRGLVR